MKFWFSLALLVVRFIAEVAKLEGKKTVAEFVEMPDKPALLFDPNRK